MTAPLADAPLAEIPFSLPVLEREVKEMEATLALLKRRDEAEAELRARGMDGAIDKMRPAEIIALVGRRRGCSVAEIQSRGGVKPIYEARHEVFYLLSLLTRADGSPRFSTPQIGRMVSSRPNEPFDHTTVLNGIARHAERLRAFAAGERPRPTKCMARPRGRRITTTRQETKVVCMLPPDVTCPGCGALGGEPCRDGASRG